MADEVGLGRIEIRGQKCKGRLLGKRTRSVLSSSAGGVACCEITPPCPHGHNETSAEGGESGPRPSALRKSRGRGPSQSLSTADFVFQLATQTVDDPSQRRPVTLY